MAIELPSGPAVLKERLAALEDPILAERLFRENPELFAPEPPRTEREVLRWATRRVGTAIIAITAAVSIVAGYVGSEFTRHRAPAAPAIAPAALAVPVMHARPPARHAVAHKPAAAHHAAVATPHHRAAAPIVRRAAVAAPVYVAPVYHAPRVVHVAPAAQPDREAQLLRARLHARDLDVARLQAEAARARAAARAAKAQAQARAHAVTTAPAPQTRPQSEPAAATDNATASGRGPEPGPGAGTGPSGGSGPEPNGGVKNPPTSPGGVWNERLPGGHTLGGMIPPILVGVPRDSCTPQGGRIGGVQRVIEAAQIIQSLSRH